AASSASVSSVTKRRAGLSISRAPRRRIWSSIGSAGRRARGTVLSHAQELQELDALAHAAPQHGRALQHLPHELGDLARPEEERAVELLLHLEDLAVREVRVLERRDLEAVGGDQLSRLVA